MLRTFGAFLLVFLMLSAIVRLNELAALFAIAAIILFASDFAVHRFVNAARSTQSASHLKSQPLRQ